MPCLWQASIEVLSFIAHGSRAGILACPGPATVRLLTRTGSMIN